MLESTTLILLALASSAIDIRLFWISSLVIGPVLPAMSLVPARMTTAFGCRSMTSGRNRINICGVVWPLMPRPMYDLLLREEIAEARLRPGVGDRVAHEHHAGLAGAPASAGRGWRRGSARAAPSRACRASLASSRVIAAATSGPLGAAAGCGAAAAGGAGCCPDSETTNSGTVRNAALLRMRMILSWRCTVTSRRGAHGRGVVIRL